MSSLLVIVGPTASGKSALAMEVAQRYNGEIICADSRTVYKGMDIGTAKSSEQDQKKVRHHLLDVAAPNESFTAAQFKKMAQQAIEDISRRKKLPIMVGGTGLYIDAVIFDYQFGAIADPRRRAALQKMTTEELIGICQENNLALPVNMKNKRHLIRTIELGGLVDQEKKLRPNTLVVGITTDRGDLHARVIARAHKMADDGIVKEIRMLADVYGWESEAMTGSIYRILRPVVEGTLPLQEGLERFVISDMQLAKRQMTWFKRNPYIIWGDPKQLMLAVEHFVQQNKLIESMPA